MRHSREAVIERTIRAFDELEEFVSGLSADDWSRPLLNRETKDPWTLKDGLVHITYWKADTARQALGERRPKEVQGLNTHEHNHYVFERWRHSPPSEIVAWHRQVQQDVLAALKRAPESWFNGKERTRPWPADLDGHVSAHRAEMQRALGATKTNL
jgi:hypothetical protein